jgi:hypothetical protein
MTKIYGWLRYFCNGLILSSWQVLGIAANLLTSGLEEPD